MCKCYYYFFFLKLVKNMHLKMKCCPHLVLIIIIHFSCFLPSFIIFFRHFIYHIFHCSTATIIIVDAPINHHAEFPWTDFLTVLKSSYYHHYAIYDEDFILRSLLPHQIHCDRQDSNLSQYQFFFKEKT